MKFLALLIIFIPFIVCAQPKYSSESKKLYTKALKAHKDGNTDVALGLFEQCVKSEPRYAEAYLNISIIQYGKKSMGDALINAKKAYSQNKFEPSIYGQLGKCYYQAMVYDSAAHFLTKAIELDIKDEFTLIYAGKSYYQLEDYAAAESHLTNAIAVNGNNPVAYNSRGKVYFNLAEYEKAEEDFKKALELNPESVSIYSNLANTCLRNEKPEDALKYINLAMEKANEDEKNSIAYSSW